jgi:uncharacterized membrane protein
MGFFDNLFGKKEKEEKPTVPFEISTKLNPVRLLARKESTLELEVNIKNITDKPFIASLTCEVPKFLGFENVGMTKIKELRIGELEPNKEKKFYFTICSNSQTPKGTYSVLLTANQHYRDYSHILNYVKKTVEIRAV